MNPTDYIWRYESTGNPVMNFREISFYSTHDQNTGRTRVSVALSTNGIEKLVSVDGKGRTLQEASESAAAQFFQKEYVVMWGHNVPRHNGKDYRQAICTIELDGNKRYVKGSDVDFSTSTVKAVFNAYAAMYINEQQSTEEDYGLVMDDIH